MTTYTTAPLSAIIPSRTNPRKSFDEAALQDLALSIAATGVHTPVLVRPLPADRLEETAHLSPRPTYELVAGERRYRASLIAKANSIPAMVRDLTDTQVLEIQLVENLQRQDLTALEEAQGYETLMQHSGLTAEAVAEKIGKSRSYVFGRLKLLDAGQDVREALRTGLIDPSRALLLARIPSTLLQVKALKEILRPNHPEGVMPSRLAGEHIRRNYMLKIEQAPFDHTDGSLSPRACTVCPTRTGADQDIFADVMGADMCTDPSCYDNKVQQHHSRRRAQLEAAGHRIIDGQEAKEIMPWSMSGPNGYARLDDAADSPTKDTLRTELAKLIDSGEVVPTIIVNPHKEGDMIAVVPEDQVPALLHRANKKKAAAAAKEQAETQAQADFDREAQRIKRNFEQSYLTEVLKRTAQRIQGHRVEGIDMQLYSAKNIVQNDMTHIAKTALCDALGLSPTTGDKENPTTGDAFDAVEAALIEWLDRSHEGKGSASNPVRDMANAWLLVMAANECQACHYSNDDDNHQALFIAAKIAGVNHIAVRIEMADTLRAELTAAEAKKPSPPLPPAAQANGVRGVNETKQGQNPGKRKPLKGAKPPASPKLSADEAMQGIADAMQGNEGGADPGPLEPNPGADAPGEGVGPAARPDGAPLLKVGDQARLNSGSSVFHGKICTIGALHKNGKATVTVDGLACEYTFDLSELERVEGGAE